jgi:hypothetical protein
MRHFRRSFAVVAGSFVVFLVVNRVSAERLRFLLLEQSARWLFHRGSRFVGFVDWDQSEFMSALAPVEDVRVPRRLTPVD